jgi:hypothetical protein
VIWGDFRGDKWNARGGGGDDWIMEGSVRMMCIFMEDASWDCPKDGVQSQFNKPHSFHEAGTPLCLGKYTSGGLAKETCHLSTASLPPTHDGLAEITKKKGLNVAFDSSDWAIVFS